MKTISVEVANKLPSGFIILGFKDVSNMDGVLIKDAILVVWIDKYGSRKATFHPETGEYLGEYLG